MELDRAQLLKDFNSLYKNEFDSLTKDDFIKMQKKASNFELSSILNTGGALVFPHVHVADCGYMLLAVINAILKSGSKKVLAISVLHPFSDEMEEARIRIATNSLENITKEPLRGIYGPGLSEKIDTWKDDHALYAFRRMLKVVSESIGVEEPTVIERYIHLTGDKPQTLPGIEELKELAKDSVIVATADHSHHGIAYGTPKEKAYFPDNKGLKIIKARVQEGLELLDVGDYKQYIKHCYNVTGSDWRDAGIVIRYLLGPMKSNIIDVIGSDFSELPYKSESPSWALGALVSCEKII
ncbi:hypothetical protein [Francisella sp. SYW-9]|uniref:hypothetical protein n=1 Tax=Francisella sp. SYW-9 TaxID=2610888 RepID=UPI00123DB87F|nr:hypothetical protein [Francisella sp. SYW-9]